MKAAATNGAAAESLEAIKAAGLRFSNDSRMGIAREKAGKDFVFKTAEGKRMRDAETVRRIRALVIPPAWTDVWICPFENGHIQATGRDARGRKQYRYHARWREQRDENKFERILDFAKVLPRIRRRVSRDMKRPGMPREKVLATVVRLLEVTLIRVGNEEYARTNHSYGLTSMRNRHVHVARGGDIAFSFRGKSGKRHEISVHDARLAKIVRKCQDLPGQDLFEYAEADGSAHNLTSEDVNEYLREIAGADYTAKDFRTWAGTVLAAIALRQFENIDTNAQAKKNIVAAVESVARMLGNTPSVCRKCYIHPEVLNSYLAGETIATVEQRLGQKMDRELSRLKGDEAAVMTLLRARLKRAKRAGNKPVLATWAASVRKISKRGKRSPKALTRSP